MEKDPLGLRRSAPKVAQSDFADPVLEQFSVQVSVAQIGGAYYGHLKVFRRADRRTLFPFDGAPTIGPFSISNDAREAAHLAAKKVIADDLANPEKPN